MNNNKKLIGFLFFIGYLLLGLITFKDYGVHWDETDNQNLGMRWGLYLRDFTFKNLNPTPSLNREDKIHGATFEIFLVFIEKRLLKLTDSRDIILMRHLLTFLLFYASVFFFYLLCKYLFKNWKIGLLGSLLLILHPRIYAHSFYNSVDIPLLSLYIISTYTLFIFLEKKTAARAIFHGVACSILIGIRMVGLIIPLCTFIFLVADLIKSRGAIERRRIIKGLVLYLFVFGISTILFSPVLWANPLNNFLLIIRNSRFTHAGRWAGPPSPWYYNLKWMMITTPLLYSCYFLVGLFSSIDSLFKKQSGSSSRDNAVIIFLFFLPLIFPVIFKTILFDEWRHHYFIYPIFVLFCLTGLISFYAFLKIRFHGLKYKIMNLAYISLVVFGFLHAAYFMVRYHPHQNIYSNRLSGKNMDRAKVNLALDYWGLSYRKALEYILKNDKSELINIYAYNRPGYLNAKILKPEDRKRLVYGRQKKAKYFLGNYRWREDAYDKPQFKNEFYSLKINNTKFMVVYKLKERAKKKTKLRSSRDLPPLNRSKYQV